MSKSPPKPVPAAEPLPRVHYSFLRILTGSDLSTRRLPRMSVTSPNPGPVVWLTACGHGDEVGGMVIVQEIFKRVRRELRRGSVNAFPLMNPIGMDTISRNITMSREDLNRSFPGNPQGSLGERLAHLIFSTVMDTAPTLALDLHNDWIKSMPYVVVDRISGESGEDICPKVADFGRQTGLCIIRDPEELRRTLSYNLLLRKVPALTLELGEPYVVNEGNIRFGVGAIWNVLAGLDMVAPLEPPFCYPLADAYGQGRILTYFDKPYSAKSGIVRFLAGPGDIVKPDQPLAKIFNPFGKQVETVRALRPAVVLGHSDSSVVFPGMPLMAFGVAEDATA